MKMRHYVVTNVETGGKTVVRASNRHAARAAVTRLGFRVDLATGDELVDLVRRGAPFIDEQAAGEDSTAETVEP